MNSSTPSLLSDSSSSFVNSSTPNKADPHQIQSKTSRDESILPQNSFQGTPYSISNAFDESSRPIRSRSSHTPSKPPQIRREESPVCNTGSRHGWLYNQKYERTNERMGRNNTEVSIRWLKDFLTYINISLFSGHTDQPSFKP